MTAAPMLSSLAAAMHVQGSSAIGNLARGIVQCDVGCGESSNAMCKGVARWCYSARYVGQCKGMGWSSKCARSLALHITYTEQLSAAVQLGFRAMHTPSSTQAWVSQLAALDTRGWLCSTTQKLTMQTRNQHKRTVKLTMQSRNQHSQARKLPM